MQQFPMEKLAMNTGDLFREASAAPVAITEHGKPQFVVVSIEQFEALLARRSSQVAAGVEDMPDDLGDLLDRAFEDYFRSR